MRKYLIWMQLFLWSSVGLVWKEWPDNSLHVVGCDVGQGDAFVVIKGFNQIIIDTGPDNSGFSRCLSNHLPFWDRKLELVVISHPQNDHYGNLADLLESFKVQVLLVPDVANDSKQFVELVNLANEMDVSISPAIRGNMIRIGDLNWQIIWPKVAYAGLDAWNYDPKWLSESLVSQDTSKLELEDVNKASIVLQLTYHNFTSLFTGDLTIEEELSLVDAELIKDVDVLKIPHHGSKSSSSIEFIKAARPEIGLIGVGKNNRFGHPNSLVLERYRGEGVQVIRTDNNGEIEIVTDGHQIEVK